MLRIDSHTHTAYSDGTDTPTELLFKARDAGLDMIGLTDHDTFAGWDEGEASVKESHVALIRGVEMSCAASGITVHLLAYLPDPTNTGLLDCFEKARNSRKTRAQRMVENLAEDYPITWDTVLEFAPDGGPIGRPHIADALVAVGVFENRSQAFEKILHPSGPYFVHPKARARQRLFSDEVIYDMKDAGLFGIERDHRDHQAEDREAVQRLADDLGLAIFGSSDYHGLGKPNQLGENLTDPEVISQVEDAGTMEVIRP